VRREVHALRAIGRCRSRQDERQHPYGGFSQWVARNRKGIVRHVSDENLLSVWDRKLSVTADTYTHVLLDDRELNYPRAARGQRLNVDDRGLEREAAHASRSCN
jgi:hypothetical protein